MPYSSRSNNMPARLTGALGVAIPVAGTEWLLLWLDGPWWWPRLTMPLEMAALGASALVACVVLHAFLLYTRRMPHYYGLLESGPMELGYAVIAAIIVVPGLLPFETMRKLLALAIPLVVLGFHAAAVYASRQGRRAG